MKKNITKNKKILILSCLFVFIFTFSTLANQVIEINIEGNNYFNEKEIKDMLITEIDDVFSIRTLNRDMENIKKTGYFKDVNVSVNDNEKGTIINFNLTENDVLREINFKGNKRVSNRQLERLLNLEKMKVINQEKLKEGIKNIEKYYQDLGYLLADINLKNTNSKIEIEINEGLIKEINIISQEELNKEEIFKELLFETGDLYSESEMRRSIARLKNTGNYQNINYNLNQKEKIVEIKINEGNDFPFGLGLRYDNFNGMSFLVGYKNNNFISSNKELNLYMQNGNNFSKYNLEYKVPTILNSFLDFRLNAYHKEILKIDDNEFSYTGLESNLSFSPFRNFKETFVFSYNYISEDEKINSYFINEEHLELIELGLNSEYNTLNHDLKEGENFNLLLNSYRLSDVNADYENKITYEFAKITLNLEKYFSLNDYNNFYSNLKLGTSYNDLPFNQKYYLDVRGYSKDYFQKESKNDFVNDNIFSLNLEYHFSPFIFEEKEMWGEILDLTSLDLFTFLDLGQANKDFEIDNLYYSLGTGTKVNTFLGELNLSINYPLNNIEGFNDENITFTIKNNF